MRDHPGPEPLRAEGGDIVTRSIQPIVDDLALARRASAFAALPDEERRERIHLAAWQCVCWAEARKWVAQVREMNRESGDHPGGFGWMALGEKERAA